MTEQHNPHNFPAFITASGRARLSLKVQVRDLIGGRSPFAYGELDPRFEVFTYNNRRSTTYLEKQCHKIGMPVTVTAKGFRPWTWFGKVGPLIHALEASKADFVFCVDGDDSFPIRFPTWEEVQDIRPGMLFANGANWPHVRWLPANEKFYLTAGLYCGERTTVLKLLKVTERMFRHRVPVVYWRGFQDQLAWKFHQYYDPDLLKIDTTGRLLNNFYWRFNVIKELAKVKGNA